MQINRKKIAVGVVTATLAVGLVDAPGAVADPSIAGTYNTVPITRVIDTRAGTGTPAAAVAPGQTLTVKIADPLPVATVSAVALNVTVNSPTKAGYLVVFPGGSTRPKTSNINFAPKTNTPNNVIVGTGAGSTVSFYNGSVGTIQLIADLYGYWTTGRVDTATGGAFTAVAPSRTFDSRLTGKSLAANSSGSVAIAGHSGVPTTNVSAVVANVTAVAPAAAGYFRVAASASDPTAASTVDFTAGETRANVDIVPLNTDGSIAITNMSGGRANYVVDVLGYFTSGNPMVDGAFTASTPYRTEDTRTDGSAVAANSTLTVPVFPNNGTGAFFKSVVVNITVTDPTAGGFLVPSDGVGTTPATSVASFKATQTIANTVVVPVNPDGSIAILNSSNGTVQVIVDVQGFMVNDLSGQSPGVAQSRVQKALQNARTLAAKRLSR